MLQSNDMDRLSAREKYLSRKMLTPQISVAICQPRKTMPEYEFLTLKITLITVYNTRLKTH